MAHPWLWGCEKRLRFIKEVHQVISNFRAMVNRAKIEALDEQCWDTHCGGWNFCFMIELYNHMDATVKSPYDVQSVCSLIRFIRNLYSRHAQIGRDLSYLPCGNFLGTTDKKLEYVLRVAFPNLLTYLYNELQTQHVIHLASFY